MAPFFNTSSPFDTDVEKATDELNTTEDWALILEICDRVQTNPSGAKDCLKSIVKRMNHKIPLVAMQSLTLLDACVKNAGRPFLLEVTSRDFISNCRTLIGSKGHPKVAKKLKQMIKKWAETEFKSDPALDLIPSFYRSLKSEGAYSEDASPPPEKAHVSKNPEVVGSQQEVDDIAKAIALSLEADAKKASSALYPNFAPSTSGPAVPSATFHEPRKVRALYDFEAAEDNELTFKAGEIVFVIDDSDQNWWKGSNSRGEGLFPANFVTADLNTEVVAETTPDKKTVQFSEEVEVKTVEAFPQVVEIDEEKIDECLSMIQNADPTGDASGDPPELLSLEEGSKAMGPLIDKELQTIDRKYNDLMQLNTSVLDALEMYNNLMHDQPTYGYPRPVQGTPGKMGMPQMYDMGGQQMAQQMPQMYPGQYAYAPPIPHMASMPPGQPQMYPGQQMPPGQPMPSEQQMPPAQHIPSGQQMPTGQHMLPGQQMIPGQGMPMGAVGSDGAQVGQDPGMPPISQLHLSGSGMALPSGGPNDPSNMSNNAIPPMGMANLYNPTMPVDAYSQPVMSLLPSQGALQPGQQPMLAPTQQLYM